MLRFSGAGVSDVGRVRPHNEDSGFVGPYVAVVADGVGGAAAGEIASATAAYSASAVALGRLGQRPEQVLAEAYAAAADGVRMGVQRDLDRLGMATTLTMLVTDGRERRARARRRLARLPASATASCARSPRTTPTSSTWSTPGS